MLLSTRAARPRGRGGRCPPARRARVWVALRAAAAPVCPSVRGSGEAPAQGTRRRHSPPGANGSRHSLHWATLPPPAGRPSGAGHSELAPSAPAATAATEPRPRTGPGRLLARIDLPRLHTFLGVEKTRNRFILLCGELPPCFASPPSELPSMSTAHRAPPTQPVRPAGQLTCSMHASASRRALREGDLGRDDRRPRSRPIICLAGVCGCWGFGGEGAVWMRGFSWPRALARRALRGRVAVRPSGVRSTRRTGGRAQECRLASRIRADSDGASGVMARLLPSL